MIPLSGSSKVIDREVSNNADSLNVNEHVSLNVNEQVYNYKIVNKNKYAWCQRKDNIGFNTFHIKS